ncbi:protein kinase [Streptomyces sp. MUM 203J]|uniref:protein kinase domain-containing protein n=1 Tax=Streptomyces sp. MUM 203J TaxID=2791990 RepID=UPI001F04269D|nr:protein kinase [Streptomyces sp. MUM 203J]MCH0541856.1 protein kinase [Streptomyces sp. MUM 203J]
MQPLDADEPRAIGSYRLLGRLGAGGMGRVYLARSAGGRTVAVKVVHPHFALDEEFRERFRREVASARRVGAEWTAPVLDADPEAPVPWVATGYVAGPPLSRAVAAHGPLPERSVRVLGAGLAEALAAVHGLGLVHRDVKPSNVLLALDGPRLIDFGIARATDGTASLTSTGVSVGSPGYMSPEQILGKAGGAGIGGATDVFSLGAVLAFAATGREPFSGDSSAALLYKVVHEEPDLAPELAGELRELVAACLAKDPEARPAPGELARALAPGGAAASAAGGWLPPGVVEDVSRAVVRLLDLEAASPVAGDEPAASPAPGPGPASGPVPFSSPAVAPGAERSPTASGGFGPPVAQLPTMDAVPPPRAPVSVSVSAASEPAGPRGGRRVSCTLALAVAGAVAAATVGAAVLFDLLPGSGEHRDVAGEAPGTTASTSASAPVADGTTASAVPQAFVGTWKGAVTVEHPVLGEFSGGTFEVVVKDGKLKERIGTVDQWDQLGRHICQDVLALRSATDDTLVTESSPGEKSGGPCTGGTHTVTLRLKDGKLHYTSDDKAAGSPRAVLDRRDQD